MWMVWLSHKIFPFLFSLRTAENKNTFQENKDDGIEEGGQLPASTINPIPTPLFTLRSCNSIPKKIHLSFFSKQNFYLQTALTKTLPHSHKKNSDCQVTHPFSLGATMAKMLLEHEFPRTFMVIINLYILKLHIAPSFHYLHINVAHSTTSTHLLAGS